MIIHNNVDDRKDSFCAAWMWTGWRKPRSELEATSIPFVHPENVGKVVIMILGEAVIFEFLPYLALTIGPSILLFTTSTSTTATRPGK